MNKEAHAYLEDLLKKMEADGLGFRVIYEREWPDSQVTDLQPQAGLGTSGEETNHNVTATQALEALGACDEEWVNVYRGAKCIGQMYLVHEYEHGEPEEVICDYHVSLEPWINPKEAA